MSHHRVRLLYNHSDPFNITKMYGHIHSRSTAVRQKLPNPQTSLSLIECLDKNDIPKVQLNPPVYQIANTSTGS